MLRYLPVVFLVILMGCTPAYDAHYWRQYAWIAQDEGLLRTDRNPADAPFSNEDLVRNIGVIMFQAEEHNKLTGRQFPGREVPLHRMEGDVRFMIGAGASPQDRTWVNGFVQRMRELTGLTIRESNNAPQIRIEFLDHDARLALGQELAGSDRWDFAGDTLLRGMPGLVCVAFETRKRDEKNSSFLIVIRSELEGIMRRACIEEEVGQAFGPNADFEAARPSIFNDDDEFALFTEHDALMFKVIYDIRLLSGQSRAQAMPVIRQIVEDLRPGG